MKKSTVLLADDHVILTEGLKSLLEDNGFEVVGIVHDGRALLAAAEKFQPDAVVIDISLPQMNGIEAARRLRTVVPDAALVILTMHVEMSFLKEAFRAGVSAYVVKQCAPDELVTALHEALQGRSYVTPLVTKEMIQSLMTEPPGEEIIELTDRQREVLQLVAEGKSIKEIAGILNVSNKTVEFHKYRIMAELGVKTTAELTKIAVKRGLVSL